MEKSLADRTNATLNDLKVLFNDLKAKTTQYTESELKTAIATLQGKVEKVMKEEENLMNFIRDKSSKIRDGKPGNPGKDGKDADESKIIKEILAKIEIPDLEEIEEKIKKIETRPLQIFGGNRPIQIREAGTIKDKAARYLNFTGATITRAADGVVTIAVAGGTKVHQEIPVNSGDSINFTIAHTPLTGTDKVIRGGTEQQAGVDYVLTATALVLTIVLAAGESLWINYEY